ncbi:unnamed protein product [Boreogadus saida]
MALKETNPSKPTVTGCLRLLCGVIFTLGTLMTLYFTFIKSTPNGNCIPLPSYANRHYNPVQKVAKKPLILIWFWPEDLKFDLDDCKKHLNIDGCRLTDDRSLYLKAKEVIFFHDAIKDDLSNLPRLRRPAFQRWIWLNLQPPANTRRIEGADNLFNLSLNFRKDADIQVRWDLTYNKIPGEAPSLPKKEHVVCYTKGDKVADNSTGHSYYKELAKHIDIKVFGGSFMSRFQNANFDAISSCKFQLAFEDFIYRDYITEKLTGPLAVGTVPVVLGPPRLNYEDFVPGDSFVHVNDFPNARSLADFLKRLDTDDTAYRRYFLWRQYFSAHRHPVADNHKLSLSYRFSSVTSGGGIKNILMWAKVSKEHHTKVAEAIGRLLRLA